MNDSENDSEEETVQLVRRAQGGDREAFDQLMLRLQSAVFGVAQRRLRNESEALETTQDVFLQVLCKLPQLREPARFAGWVRSIAVRMAINRAVRRPRELLDDGSFPAGSAHDDPLESMLRKENADQLHTSLNRLGEIDRRTLLAFYFDGRSLQQMSSDFDRPVGTIKRRLHTARNRLREELAELQPAG